MLTVQADPAAVSTYQEVLVSEWTKSLPQKVLSLLWSMLVGQDSTEEVPGLWQVLDPNDGGPFPREYFRSLVTRISGGTRFVRLSRLPELPTDYVPPTRPSSLARQANKLAVYLTLQAHTAVAGKTEFLADVQALAFQAAIHFVLPEVRRKHPLEHSLLLHSAVLFAISYSAYEPAHYAYMMSMIHDYLGDQEQRLRSLYASFRFTPPQDHSYRTKAQEFWSELLDQNRSEEAERFLLSLHWWSLPSQGDEIREMIVDAFKYILKDNGKQTPSQVGLRPCRVEI